MANTLTAIMPAMTTAMLAVLSERALLPAICQADFKAEQAALNETVTIPDAPAVAGADRTPAAIFTVAADRAVGSRTISLTKDRKFPFYLTGDDYKRIRQNPEYVPSSMMEAMRTCRNEIHSDLAGLHIHAAGYYSAATPASGAAIGTAGTTPFASNIDVISDLDKFLNDSLAPLEDRFLMIDTAAKSNLGKLGQLIKANEAGTSDLLRRGIIGQLGGFNVSWVQDVKQWTPIGTGTSYVVNGAHAAGVTTVAIDTGSGTILAGDVVTINSVKYTVLTGVAAAGNLVLTSGLVAAAADADTVTVNAISRRNMAFHKSALGLAVRVPAMPPEGDSAADSQIMVEPETGMPIRLSRYKGYGLDQYEIGAVWGVKAVRPSLLKILLG